MFCKIWDFICPSLRSTEMKSYWTSENESKAISVERVQIKSSILSNTVD